MKCQKCNTVNEESNKFCINCGKKLNNEVISDSVVENKDKKVEEVSSIKINVQPEVNENVEEKSDEDKENGSSVQINIQSEVDESKVNEETEEEHTGEVNSIEMNVQQEASENNNVINNSNNKNIGLIIKDYLFMIIATILRPFTAFKDELNKFTNIKDSLILSGIIAGFFTIISLIRAMVDAVFVKSFDWSVGEEVTKITWDNLGNVEYFSVIGKNLLAYLGIMLAIAGVYYIASLIVKKDVNFSKLLCIASVSIVPVFLCTSIIGPILAIVLVELQIIVTVVGLVYTLLLVYEGMNQEIVLEGNMKYYFNLIVLTILIIGIFYVYSRIVVSQVTNELGDALKLFG